MGSSGNNAAMLLFFHGLVGASLFAAPPPVASMVTVPGGPFVRGDSEGEPDEKPQQRITVASFSIDRTEVTVAAYAACVAAKACPELPRRKTPDSPNLPVTHVSWQEATAFCAWQGKRLPSETEWEKAARGTDGRRYPWGNDFSCQMGNFGNFSMDGRCAEEGAPGKPVAVGSYPSGASPYGALDLAGNVWEWTADAYRKDAYKQAVATAVHGSPSEKLRVLRGGGCCSIFGLPRTSDRLGLPLDYRDADIGFRCAKDGAADTQPASGHATGHSFPPTKP